MTGLRRALLALALAAVVVAAGVSALILSSEHEQLRGVTAGLGSVIGLSFVGTGLFAWWRRPHNRFGALMTAVGFAWFLGGLQASSLVLPFTVGLLFDSLFLAICAHMLLTYPSGRLETRGQRLTTLGAYAISLSGLALALFLDPDDLGCGDCPRNLLLVARDQQVVDVMLVVVNVMVVAVCVAIIVALAARWRRASRPLRRSLAPRALVRGGADRAGRPGFGDRGGGLPGRGQRDLRRRAAGLPVGAVRVPVRAAALPRLARGRGLGADRTPG